MATQYISDCDHYDVVVEKIRNAKSMLWIGTTDIKNLHIEHCLQCGRRQYYSDTIK